MRQVVHMRSSSPWRFRRTESQQFQGGLRYEALTPAQIQRAAEASAREDEKSATTTLPAWASAHEYQAKVMDGIAAMSALVTSACVGVARSERGTRAFARSNPIRLH